MVVLFPTCSEYPSTGALFNLFKQKEGRRDEAGRDHLTTPTVSQATSPRCLGPGSAGVNVPPAALAGLTNVALFTTEHPDLTPECPARPPHIGPKPTQHVPLWASLGAREVSLKDSHMLRILVVLARISKGSRREVPCCARQAQTHVQQPRGLGQGSWHLTEDLTRALFPGGSKSPPAAGPQAAMLLRNLKKHAFASSCVLITPASDFLLCPAATSSSRTPEPPAGTCHST